MQDLIEFIVKSLVDFPDQVQVSATDSDSTILLELSVSDADMGRVIGRNGRVINAIRSILQVAATKQGRRVSLELLESDERL